MVNKMAIRFPARGTFVIRNKINIETNLNISVMTHYENHNNYERGNRGANMLKNV